MPTPVPSPQLVRAFRTRPAQFLHRSCPECSRPLLRSSRHFSSGKRVSEQQSTTTPAKSLRNEWNKTRVVWRPIPIALGIGVVGFIQFLRTRQQAKEKQHEEDNRSIEGDPHEQGRPPPRERIRPSGPWQVQVMSTLPLKALSRLWGRFNELDIPYYLRVPGFKLYSWIFGVNLSEVAEPDLHTFPNLAAFFYRKLKPGARPLDPDPNALLSPADGRVIQFGTIASGGEVEQVKGVTYSLDSLLGSQSPITPVPGTSTPTSNIASSASSPQPSPSRKANKQGEAITADEEFARVNGISYTLPNLFSGPKPRSSWFSSKPKPQTITDQSTTPEQSSEKLVAEDFASSEHQAPAPWWSPFASTPTTPTQLYYIVVYLAPGDYHRFHSPVNWVVSQRRHFAGELYSVSPYLQRTLPGLFTLNERVVLLGRWRWGFFSYTPVGATNVGSIVVNFDRELRTNSLTTDTAADRAAEEAKERGEPYSGFAEASYAGASAVLKGHALSRGEEMGGFQLGSTIVLVFEAPKGRRKGSLDEGFDGERVGGWKWAVKEGDKVKMGQALGAAVEFS